jgi:hypothetical protein
MHTISVKSVSAFSPCQTPFDPHWVQAGLINYSLRLDASLFYNKIYRFKGQSAKD